MLYIRFFPDLPPITGTIVTGQHKLKVPNRLQKRVYDDFQELKMEVIF